MSQAENDNENDERRQALVEKMMEKFSLKGKKGRVFVQSVIDRVGLDRKLVENWILRAQISKRAHH